MDERRHDHRRCTSGPLLDGGAYGCYGVASTFYTGALQTVTYDIPAYRFEGCRVFTNKPPCGPKRGHGTPQPRFALELPPREDRPATRHRPGRACDAAQLRQAEHPGPSTGCASPRCGLEECIDKVVDRASSYAARARQAAAGRGMGFAISIVPVGRRHRRSTGTTCRTPRCRSGSIEGGVTAYCGAIDIGQGSDSVLAASSPKSWASSPQTCARDRRHGH